MEIGHLTNDIDIESNKDRCQGIFKPLVKLSVQIQISSRCNFMRTFSCGHHCHNFGHFDSNDFMLLTSCGHHCHYFGWQVFYNASKQAGERCIQSTMMSLFALNDIWGSFYWDFKVHKSDFKVKYWIMNI